MVATARMAGHICYVTEADIVLRKMRRYDRSIPATHTIDNRCDAAHRASHSLRQQSCNLVPAINFGL